MRDTQFTRDGTTLSYVELGGAGPPILLLHGLAGYAREWEQSAPFLIGSYRVFALATRTWQQRTTTPGGVTPAFIADCAEAIRHLGLGPVTLAGQSMGANTAMLTAAATLTS